MDFTFVILISQRNYRCRLGYQGTRSSSVFESTVFKGRVQEAAIKHRDCSNQQRILNGRMRPKYETFTFSLCCKFFFFGMPPVNPISRIADFVQRLHAQTRIFVSWVEVKEEEQAWEQVGHRRAASGITVTCHSSETFRKRWPASTSDINQKNWLWP
jgi:hypothetical protein